MLISRGPEESNSVHGAQVIGACELPVGVLETELNSSYNVVQMQAFNC